MDQQFNVMEFSSDSDKKNCLKITKTILIICTLICLIVCMIVCMIVGIGVSVKFYQLAKEDSGVVLNDFSKVVTDINLIQNDITNSYNLGVDFQTKFNLILNYAEEMKEDLNKIAKRIS